MTCPGSGTGSSTTDFGMPDDVHGHLASVRHPHPIAIDVEHLAVVDTFVGQALRVGHVVTSTLPRGELLTFLDIVEHRLQVRRQRRIELDPPAVGGVRERQPGRVQERPLEPLDGAQVGRRPAMEPAVGRIADDRMADRAQVDADLVRAPGGDRDLQQRDALVVPRRS